MFRWWWPGADVEDAELVAELKAIADAGYKGVEIADVMDSVNYPVDPDKYGYGTERWNHAVETALAAADRFGLQVDLTLGAHWPAAVPGLDVDGPDASKELGYGVHGRRAGSVQRGGAGAGGEDLRGPHVGQRRDPAPPRRRADDARRRHRGRLRDQRLRRPPLDLTSRDRPDQRVRDGKLEWTPPDGRGWVVTGLLAARHGAAQRRAVRHLGDAHHRSRVARRRPLQRERHAGDLLRYFDSAAEPAHEARCCGAPAARCSRTRWS